MKALLFILLATMSFAARAAEAPEWRPHVLIVDSLDDVKPWIEGTSARRNGDAGRLRDIPAGLKIHFPIVVTDLPSLAGRGLDLEADLEFLGPQGQVLWSRKACCRKIVRHTPRGQAVALEPAASVQFEPNDTAGTYTVRVVVNDGQRSAAAVETLRYGEARRDGLGKAGGMRLQMDVPKKNPGADRDVRDCLDLPTPAEVIKCTERKK